MHPGSLSAAARPVVFSRQQRLSGLRVAVSVAVPDRASWGHASDLDRQMFRFVSQFSGLVMSYGGTVVHGSHPSFVPLLVEQARSHQGQSDAATTLKLTLITSACHDRPSTILSRLPASVGVVLDAHVDGAGESETHAPGVLTASRLALISQADVLIVVGGWNGGGYDEGLLEELALARASGLACFVVAAVGSGNSLLRGLVSETSRGNMLTRRMVRTLAESEECFDTAVGTLLAHLNKNAEAFRVRRGRGGVAFHSHATRLEPAHENGSPIMRAWIPRIAVGESAVRFAKVNSAFSELTRRSITDRIANVVGLTQLMASLTRHRADKLSSRFRIDASMNMLETFALIPSARQGEVGARDYLIGSSGLRLETVLASMQLREVRRLCERLALPHGSSHKNVLIRRVVDGFAASRRLQDASRRVRANFPGRARAA